MSRSPSEFKNHHFVSKPLFKWILIEVTNAINLLASIPNLHSPRGPMWTLMGQRTVTPPPLDDSWDQAKIKINRKKKHVRTLAPLWLRTFVRLFDHSRTRKTFLNPQTIILHQSLVKLCSQVPISGVSDLGVSQDSFGPACGSEGWTHTHTHTHTIPLAQISACSVSQLRLNGVFIGSRSVRCKSSQESLCPLRVKLLSALCLISGLCKKESGKRRCSQGWHWYQDTSGMGCCVWSKNKCPRAWGVSSWQRR